MLLPLPPLVMPHAPLRFTDASVGRREYAVELCLEDPKGPTMTETATIAERIGPRFMGFERTRYVVASANDDGSPFYRAGKQESVLVNPNGSHRSDGAPRISLPDVTFPDGPLTPGTEWTSSIFGTESVRCRYVGDETVAGRPAVRMSLQTIEAKGGLTFEEAYILIDRTDALPLQSFIRARVEFLGEMKALFRLRRTNVPGLGLPR